MISVETQKTLKWIPIANVAPLFCWMVACAHNAYKMWDFIKALFKAFLCIFIIQLPRVILLVNYDNKLINQLTLYISLYLMFWAVSWVAINFQEKVLGL